MPAHRIVVVELAADQARRQSNGFEVETLVDTHRPVDGHPQRAATELEVVELEVQVGHDRSDQALDFLQRARVAHLISPLLSLAVVLWPCSGRPRAYQ